MSYAIFGRLIAAPEPTHGVYRATVTLHSRSATGEREQIASVTTAGDGGFKLTFDRELIEPAIIFQLPSGTTLDPVPFEWIAGAAETRLPDQVIDRSVLGGVSGWSWTISGRVVTGSESGPGIVGAKVSFRCLASTSDVVEAAETTTADDGSFVVQFDRQPPIDAPSLLVTLPSGTVLNEIPITWNSSTAEQALPSPIVAGDGDGEGGDSETRYVILGRVALGSEHGPGVAGAIVTLRSYAPNEQQVTIAGTTSQRDGSIVLVCRAELSSPSLYVTLASGAFLEERSYYGSTEQPLLDFGTFIVPADQVTTSLPRLSDVRPDRPRISGRVVDSGGQCSLHCLQVLIEGTRDVAQPFRAIAVTRTDRTGRFFTDYPPTPLAAARARIPGVDQPILLPTTADGLLESDPLLVVDIKQAEHTHSEAGCDCGEVREVPRLPSQEQLADGSSTYSTDLGPGCITFNTPNRAIEEFDFWTVVRTSQPAIRLSTAENAWGEVVARKEPLEDPIRWEASAPTFQAASVAHGHLLHIRQTWYADGYSLGDLLYSLPLAPGQKKQISIVEWRRTETTARTELTSYAEEVSANLNRDRDITEVITGALTEQTRGGSSSSTSGIAAGTGGAANGSYQGINFGALFGISGGVSQADSSSWQMSARNMSSTSMNGLRDKVLQSASAVRSVRSTVVSSVGQSESVRAETETVANHNHCHALTMQYFEVLRHFQMRHELVEVKECLFIPLPMTPFDAAKALRWRDNLAPYLLKSDLRGGLDALQRVETQWQHVPTPPGRYADENVIEITGEIEIEFQAYPPPLPTPTTEPAAASAQELSALGIFASILFPPLAVALPGFVLTMATSGVASLKSTEERFRYDHFHREYMPRFAARFVNELSLAIEKNDGTVASVPNVDFTLVSRYAPDRRLTAVFRASMSGMTRAQIAAVRIETKNGVPDAVRCLIRSITASYATGTFSHSLVYNPRLNDDIDASRLVGTGVFPNTIFSIVKPPFSDPVRARTPLDQWENRSPRDEDRRLATRLLDHLNANNEYYHHALWWTMDPNRRTLILDGYLAPNGGGRSIAQLVENKLIGMVGNTLVMPVAPGVHLDPLFRLEDKEDTTPTEETAPNAERSAKGDVRDVSGLLAYYAPLTPVPPARVSLPTKGVFAEAVLGACNACERIDDSRFWRWEQSPIDEPPAIDPSNTSSRRTEPVPATPTAYPTPIVNIQTAPSAPDPTDMTKVYELLGREAFRDVTGLAGTQANVAAAYRQNLETALSFGKEASDLAKQAAMLKSKDQALSAVDAAEGKGQITKEEAHDLRLSALKKMVGDTGGSTDAAVDSAKKRLQVVDDAGKGGVVDSSTARSLSGEILGGLARGGAASDPERSAVAAKIAELDPGDVSRLELGRGNEIVKVEAHAPGQRYRSAGVGDASRWTDLISFVPPSEVLTSVRQRGLTVQSLDEGYGDVNLDFYIVEISKLPNNPATSAPFTGTELFEHIRRNFATLLVRYPAMPGPSMVEYEPADLTKWSSAQALGSVMKFRIDGRPFAEEWWSVLGVPIPEWGLVVCSEHSADEAAGSWEWKFVTLRGPAPIGYHPVSGTRQFRLRKMGDSWVFIVRAADRVSTVFDYAASPQVFRGADSYWNGFRANLIAFVHANAGQAANGPSYSERHNWSAAKQLGASVSTI